GVRQFVHLLTVAPVPGDRMALTCLAHRQTHPGWRRRRAAQGLLIAGSRSTSPGQGDDSPRARPFRPMCPTGTAAWRVFVEFWQLIGCQNSTEREIPRSDDA